jgi:hypothetical protein
MLEFEFGEFSRHFQNSNSPNILEFEYEFELGEFFATPAPDPIEPRHRILDFGQVILHMATLHHTKFSPHIRSILTSAFGGTTYQINTSL